MDSRDKVRQQIIAYAMYYLGCRALSPYDAYQIAVKVSKGYNDRAIDYIIEHDDLDYDHVVKNTLEVLNG